MREGCQLTLQKLQADPNDQKAWEFAYTILCGNSRPKSSTLQSYIGPFAWSLVARLAKPLPDSNAHFTLTEVHARVILSACAAIQMSEKSIELKFLDFEKLIVAAATVLVDQGHTQIATVLISLFHARLINLKSKNSNISLPLNYESPEMISILTKSPVLDIGPAMNKNGNWLNLVCSFYTIWIRLCPKACHAASLIKEPLFITQISLAGEKMLQLFCYHLRRHNSLDIIHLRPFYHAVHLAGGQNSISASLAWRHLITYPILPVDSYHLYLQPFTSLKESSDCAIFEKLQNLNEQHLNEILTLPCLTEQEKLIITIIISSNVPENFILKQPCTPSLIFEQSFAQFCARKMITCKSVRDNLSVPLIMIYLSFTQLRHPLSISTLELLTRALIADPSYRTELVSTVVSRLSAFAKHVYKSKPDLLSASKPPLALIKALATHDLSIEALSINESMNKNCASWACTIFSFSKLDDGIILELLTSLCPAASFVESAMKIVSDPIADFQYNKRGLQRILRIIHDNANHQLQLKCHFVAIRMEKFYEGWLERSINLNTSINLIWKFYADNQSSLQEYHHHHQDPSLDQFAKKQLSILLGLKGIRHCPEYDDFVGLSSLKSTLPVEFSHMVYCPSINASFNLYRIKNMKGAWEESINAFKKLSKSKLGSFSTRYEILIILLWILRLARAIGCNESLSYYYNISKTYAKTIGSPVWVEIFNNEYLGHDRGIFSRLGTIIDHVVPKFKHQLQYPFHPYLENQVSIFISPNRKKHMAPQLTVEQLFNTDMDLINLYDAIELIYSFGTPGHLLKIMNDLLHHFVSKKPNNFENLIMHALLLLSRELEFTPNSRSDCLWGEKIPIICSRLLKKGTPSLLTIHLDHSRMIFYALHCSSDETISISHCFVGEFLPTIFLEYQDIMFQNRAILFPPSHSDDTNPTTNQVTIDRKAWWDKRRSLEARMKAVINNLNSYLLIPLLNSLEFDTSIGVKLGSKHVHRHSESSLIQMTHQENPFTVPEVPTLNKPYTICLALDRCSHWIPWEAFNSFSNFNICRTLYIDTNTTFLTKYHKLDATCQVIKSGIETPDDLTNPPDIACTSHTLASTENNLICSEKSVKALVNPSGDLKKTEELITALLRHYIPSTCIHAGFAPDSSTIIKWLDNRDTNLFIYAGHGGMEKFLQPRHLPQDSNYKTCPVLLFGCSSGRLDINDFPIFKSLSALAKNHKIQNNGFESISTNYTNDEMVESTPKSPEIKPNRKRNFNETLYTESSFKEIDYFGEYSMNTNCGSISNTVFKQTQLTALTKKGSPMILCSLWDVTDRDLDRITEGVIVPLESIFKYADDQSISTQISDVVIQALSASRKSCTLPLMNGASIVVYVRY